MPVRVPLLLSSLVVIAACGPSRAPGPAGPPLDRVEPVVVVHPSNPVGAITRTELRQIYLGTVTFWPDGTAVQPLGRRGSNRAWATLLHQVLKMTPRVYWRYWNTAHLAGRAEPPRQIGSLDEVTMHLLRAPGTIAVVTPDEAGRLPRAIPKVPVTPRWQAEPGDG